MNSYSNPYRRGIWLDYEKPNYWKKAVEFMSQSKNANLATFIGAVVGTIATIIGAAMVAL